MARRILTVIPNSQDGARIATLRARHQQTLGPGHRRLRELSARLTTNPDERREFLRSPDRYLQRMGVPVTDAHLVRLPVPQMQTSEACTNWGVCLYAVAAAAAWLVVAVGSYAIYTFALCSNLAWGDCIKNDELSPLHPRMTSSVV